MGTFRVSTRYGPSTISAGANLGRPSSSMCISVSAAAVGVVMLEVDSVGAEVLASINNSSSSKSDH